MKNFYNVATWYLSLAYSFETYTTLENQFCLLKWDKENTSTLTEIEIIMNKK